MQIDEPAVENTIREALRPLFEPMPAGLRDEDLLTVRAHLDELHRAVTQKIFVAMVKTNRALGIE